MSLTEINTSLVVSNNSTSQINFQNHNSIVQFPSMSTNLYLNMVKGIIHNFYTLN